MNLSNKDVCSACNDLNKLHPDFVQKGVTDEICNGFKSNTGFSSTDNSKNCTDFKMMNDCLIAGQLERIPSYDQCEWDKALIDLSKNLVHMFDALICSDCGQWENIENLWAEINKIWKEIAKIWAEIEKLKGRVDALEGTTGNLLERVERLEQWKPTVDSSITEINKSVASLNKALTKVLNNLKDGGHWQNGTGGLLDGSFKGNHTIAAGNINLFGGVADGNSFIRTSDNAQENDIFAGV